MQFGVSEAVRHWALYRPAKVAAFVDGREITFRQLDADAFAVSSFLKSTLPEERRIGICCCTKYLFLVFALATIRIGKSVVLLNSGLSPDSLSQCITDADVKAVIHDPECGHPSSLANMGLVANQSLQLDELRYIEKNDCPSHVCLPDDEWGVFYSSGTTGHPKGIERSQYSVITELLGWCLELGLSKDTHFYIGRPVYYTGGCLLALATWLAGGSVGLDRNVDWASYQKHLAVRSTTYAFFLPGQLKEFCDRAMGQRDPPLAAKTILTMGTPIDGSEKQRSRLLLKSDLIESWGNSESLGTITEAEDLDRRPNSIGRPFLTDFMLIVDDEGNPLPPGSLGRLAGSSEAGFTRYCGYPQCTAQTLTLKNDLIISSDIGCVDNDGYFYVRGRVEESFLLNNGNRIFCRDIERDVSSCGSVRECAAIWLSHPNGGGCVGIAVVPRSDSEEDIQSLVRAVIERTLAVPFERQRVLLTQSLPRNPAGKIDRVELGRMFTDHDQA